MNIIVRIKFGSHLYGTNTPDSDYDEKGIFVPSLEQIFLGDIPKSIRMDSKKNSSEKNTKDDTDIELYSLHYFIKLACEGQTVAIDMLHAPENMIIEKSPIWDYIVKNREKFYTKNLQAFVGYARKQASKYGIKGSRLSDAKKVLDFFEDYISEDNFHLKDLWDYLPIGEHIIKHPKVKEHNSLRMYEVCGRKMQETASVLYTYNIVKKFYDNYGERAKQASNNENIDWKAVSHALRAGYQLKELLTDKTITFPLKNAEYIKKIKNGELDFTKEVSPTLDKIMDEVELLSKNSDLPEKADRKFWNKFLIETIYFLY